MDTRVTILNPWDSQGNRVTDGLGIYQCVRGCGSGGYPQGYVLQHLSEEQMDDRVIGIDQQGGKSNCGYAENVMMTLRSDSHGTPHAVCYGVDCRNGVLDEEKTHTIQAKSQGGFSLNFTPSVCYAIQENCVDRDTKQSGGGVSKDVCPTLNTQDKHAVCFADMQEEQCITGRDNPSPCL